MKKLVFILLLFFKFNTNAVGQYKITSLQNITLTISAKQYTGKYAGEVNEANKPNGYGLFTYKDSSVYIVGQFLNGQLTGGSVRCKYAYSIYI